MIHKFFNPKERLIITEQGFADYTMSGMKGFIPWTHVRSVDMFVEGGGRIYTEYLKIYITGMSTLLNNFPKKVQKKACTSNTTGYVKFNFFERSLLGRGIQNLKHYR